MKKLAIVNIGFFDIRILMSYSTQLNKVGNMFLIY